MATNRARLHSKKSQIEKLQREIATLEEQEVKRLGTLALQAGLGELDLDDETLLTAFRRLAGISFRRAGAQSPRSDPAAADAGPSPDATVATPPAGDAAYGTPAGHAA
jgi:hypothetical protein